MRVATVILLSLVLCGCNSWPGPCDYAAMPVGHEMVASFEHASKTPLGSPEDLRDIRRNIAVTNPTFVITEIRWLSPREVIAQAEVSKPPDPRFGTLYYIAVHKGGSGWQSDTPYGEGVVY